MINRQTIIEIIPIKSLSTYRRLGTVKYDIKVNTRSNTETEAINDIEQLISEAEQYQKLKYLIDLELKECNKDLELFAPIDEQALIKKCEQGMMDKADFARLFTIRKKQGLEWLLKQK